MNSENNSFVRNDVNSDRDHPEPNMDKTEDDNTGSINEMMRNLEELKTTDTDMMFHLFANTEKLVNNSEREDYERKDSEHEKEKKHYGDTESLADLMDDRDKNRHKYNEEKRANDTPVADYDATRFSAPPKPSRYGPSYGEGTPVTPARDGDIDNEYEFATKEEEDLAKLDMLRKLGELTQHGVKLSTNYSMHSNYRSMKYEYELHRSIRDKSNGVKWLSNMMLNACYGIELGNKYFDPFGFKLDGWSDQMNEDSTDYFDVLGELYEKYFKAGKAIPPEFKLFLMISGSAVQFHLTRSMIGNVPSLDKMMNPGLMASLKQQSNKGANRSREAFNTAVTKEHDVAMQKASDINLLKEQQEAYMRMQQGPNLQQQQLIQQQRQIEELQNQLNMQRSDTRSMYTNNQSNGEQKTMRPPNIPANVMERLNQQGALSGAKFSEQVMNPHQQQEYQRQQQIMNHKRVLQQQEMLRQAQIQAMMNGQLNDNDSIASIDPNIDNIIDGALSKVSAVDTLDLEDISDSNSNVVLRRRRKRKQNALSVSTS